MRVNLLSEEKSSWQINWLSIAIITLLILTVFFLTYFYFANLNKLSILKKELNSLNQQLLSLQAPKEEYLSLNKELQDLEKSLVDTQLYAYTWDRVIKDQGYLTPEKLTLKSISIKDNELMLEGIADNNLQVLTYLENLQRSNNYLEVSLLHIIRQEEISFAIRAIIRREQGGE